MFVAALMPRADRLRSRFLNCWIAAMHHRQARPAASPAAIAVKWCSHLNVPCWLAPIMHCRPQLQHAPAAAACCSPASPRCAARRQLIASFRILSAAIFNSEACWLAQAQPSRLLTLLQPLVPSARHGGGRQLLFWRAVAAAASQEAHCPSIYFTTSSIYSQHVACSECSESRAASGRCPNPG